MSIGTEIPQKRTAGGCGPKKSSKKMLRRKAQAKVRAKRKASGNVKLPVAREKRRLPDYNYNLSANSAPKSQVVEKTANTQEIRVIRRRTVW